MGFAPLSLWHSLEQNQLFKVKRKKYKGIDENWGTKNEKRRKC